MFWPPNVAFLAVAPIPKTYEVEHLRDLFLGFRIGNSSRAVFLDGNSHSVEYTLWFSVFVGLSFRAAKLQNDYTMRSTSIAEVGQSNSKKNRKAFF